MPHALSAPLHEALGAISTGTPPGRQGRKLQAVFVIFYRVSDMADRSEGHMVAGSLRGLPDVKNPLIFFQVIITFRDIPRPPEDCQMSRIYCFLKVILNIQRHALFKWTPPVVVKAPPRLPNSWRQHATRRLWIELVLIDGFAGLSFCCARAARRVFIRCFE